MEMEMEMIIQKNQDFKQEIEEKDTLLNLQRMRSAQGKPSLRNQPKKSKTQFLR